jgi:hypothetical protein
MSCVLLGACGKSQHWTTLYSNKVASSESENDLAPIKPPLPETENDLGDKTSATRKIISLNPQMPSQILQGRRPL